jgi:cysteine sulfinate desulfinase/cysteine desulfurase-like protein
MALEKASCRSPLLDEEGCRGGRPKEDGHRVTDLPVDRDGLLKLADLEAAITDQTAVLSLMCRPRVSGWLFPLPLRLPIW